MRRLYVDNGSGLLLAGKPLSYYGCFLGSDGVSVGESQADGQWVRVAGSPLSYDVSLTNVQGGIQSGMRELSIHVGASGCERDIVQAKTALGALHGMRVSVGWRGLPGVYEGRLTVGAWSDVWRADPASTLARGVSLVASTCTLKVTVNPYLVGEPVQVPIPNMADVALTVGGNKPTPPTFVLRPSAGVKTVHVIVNGRYVTIPSVNASWSTAVTLMVDYERRVVLVNNSVIPVDLYSRFDWLKSGNNVVRVEGADGSVAFTPYTFI